MKRKKSMWFLTILWTAASTLGGCNPQQEITEIPVSESHQSVSLLQNNDKVVIGYIPTYVNMQNAIDNTDLDIVTHINIAFINPDTSGSVMSGGEPTCSNASASDINYVVNKAHQNGVKVLASLGGGSEPSCAGSWTTLLQPSNRATLVSNLSAFAQYFNLDGIDVDIEGNRLQDLIDAGYYTPFIENLHDSLNPQGKLVTCATATYTGGRIPVSSIPYFDYVNVMSYDNGWGTTGHHSTYAHAVGHIQTWLGLGCPAEKLVLGVPFYGYTNTVGTGGTSYKDIVGQYPAAAYVDEYAGYKYNGIPTIEAKTEYAAQHIAGVMIWELSQDTSDSLSLLQAIGRKISGSSAGLTLGYFTERVVSATVSSQNLNTNAMTANSSFSDGGTDGGSVVIEAKATGDGSATNYSTYFNYPGDPNQDLSAYNYFHISLKSASPQETIIRLEDATGQQAAFDPTDYGFAYDGNWHAMTIPFTDIFAQNSGFDISDVNNVVIVKSIPGMAGSITPSTYVFHVDDVYFSENN